MIDPHADGAPQAFRAGRDLRGLGPHFIDAMWSQALQLAKQILEGQLPSLEDWPNQRRRWRHRH
jgi:hypothetical protein